MRKTGSVTDILSGINNDSMYIEEIESNDNITDNELELSSLSWASMVEEELGESMEEHILSQSFNEIEHLSDKTETDIIDIDEIMALNYKTLSDLNILKYQTMISGYLRKQTRDYMEVDIKTEEGFDFDTYLKRLVWLKESSLFVSDKIGLGPYNHKHDEGKSITRSSYKFCDNGYNCEFNYNHEKYKGCYAQHFVHNMVHADICSLIKYIEEKTKAKKISHNEIKKCINTISFVFNHMYEELGFVNYFYKNCENLHKERTPVAKKTKNKRKKKKVVSQPSQ